MKQFVNDTIGLILIIGFFANGVWWWKYSLLKDQIKRDKIQYEEELANQKDYYQRTSTMDRYLSRVNGCYAILEEVCGRSGQYFKCKEVLQDVCEEVMRGW